jgi:putative DNA primase/helicase
LQAGKTDAGPTIQHIAAHMGGEVHTGRQAIVPGPGHSTVDRSLSITINDAGDDVLVYSFAGDDPIECKDGARQKPRMADRQPTGRGRSNGHGRAQAAIDAMTKAAASPAPTPIVIG